MVSKRKREEAVDCLLAHADTWAFADGGRWAISDNALGHLARRAIDRAVYSAEVRDWSVQEVRGSKVMWQMLEAAGLLLDGWSPGDPDPVFREK